MKNRPCGSWRVLGTVWCLGLMAGDVWAGVDLVSTNRDWAAQASGGGISINPLLNADGRFVLFASTAENLVAGTNISFVELLPHPGMNVFMRDRTSGSTVLVSVNADGTGGGNADSVPAGVSADGRYAVFQSSASNLVINDTNNATDIFVRDLASNQTILVSIATNAACGSRLSKQPVMTPDARYVAFASLAPDLVEGDTNNIADVFVRDLQSGVTRLVSWGATPSSATSSSDAPLITPDGRHVAFLSTAVGLVDGVATTGEVYVRDVVAGITYCPSTNAHQVYRTATSVLSYSPTISADGQHIAFVACPTPWTGTNAILRCNLLTGATNIVSMGGFNQVSGQKHFRELDMTPDGRFIVYLGKNGSTVQVYLWDALDSSTTLVSADLTNAPAAYGFCDAPVVSTDGNRVAFLSNATNLVANALAEGVHLYVRDVAAGTTRLIDAATDGRASIHDLLTEPRLSAEGNWLAFDCTGSDLVTNDANACFDVFVRSLASDQVELVSRRAVSLPSHTTALGSYGAVLSASADGSFLAFAATPGGRLSGSTNVHRGVFVRDLMQGTNLIVSLSTNGVTEADSTATDPSVSADGRVVAFSSAADNLVPRDSNSYPDVFVRDLASGTNALVSVAADGVSAANGASSSGVLSKDGRHVMFRSRASNLGSGTFSGSYDWLFWRDLQAPTNCVVNRTGISCAAMTPNGRFVAFGGGSANLYVWDSQSTQMIYSETTPALALVALSADAGRVAAAKGSQIYFVDRSAGTNCVLVPSTKLTALGHGSLQFSADGRFLVYVTAEPVAPGDLNGVADTYLYDAQEQTHKLISRQFDSEVAGNAASDGPVISPDGRFVAFRSTASDLIAGAPTNAIGLFLYDGQSAGTVALSASYAGSVPANGLSTSPVFSGDSGTVFFQSWLPDLVEDDFNQAPDLFAVRLTASTPILVGQIVYVPSLGQNPKLTWVAAPGKTYKVQYKGLLSDPVWLDLAVEVTILDNRASAEDTTPRGTSRFYRIVAF